MGGSLGQIGIYMCGFYGMTCAVVVTPTLFILFPPQAPITFSGRHNWTSWCTEMFCVVYQCTQGKSDRENCILTSLKVASCRESCKGKLSGVSCGVIGFWSKRNHKCSCEFPACCLFYFIENFLGGRFCYWEIDYFGLFINYPKTELALDVRW